MGGGVEDKFNLWPNYDGVVTVETSVCWTPPIYLVAAATAATAASY